MNRREFLTVAAVVLSVVALVAVGTLAGHAAPAEPAAGPTDRLTEITLTSPDGRSTVQISATDDGAFVTLTGQAGLAVFRDRDGLNQAISAGVSGDETSLLEIPAAVPPDSDCDKPR